MLPCRRGGTAPTLSTEGGGEDGMPIQEHLQSLEHHAPNAILERMRRRISRVGLLVGFVSSLLTALVIFAVCACKSIR
jgi:hypothetical protein